MPARPALSCGVAIRLVRAQLIHTPLDPFEVEDALEAVADGAVAYEPGGRIRGVGSYSELRERFPDAPVEDHRDSLLLPGFVDAHVHYPQLAILGSMGRHLLAWLDERTLPEEVRFSDPSYARARASAFLAALLRSGTTSALVFGAHFPTAMEVFFEEASRSGLRIAAGLTVSDRGLRAELHTTPEEAYRQGRQLAEGWHGHGMLRYAVTPRFSLSCSEGLLDACGALAEEFPGALVTSHLNESPEEKTVVAGLFPWARDYLETYERSGLVAERSVFAHNVHPTASELERLARAGSAVCHCPTSNTFLGSGLFPLRRHLDSGVRLALGSDVGAGVGFGLFKEGLAAHGVQMLREDGFELRSDHLLYLATAAGARALGLHGVGWFAPGMEFDAVLVKAAPDSILADVWANSPSAHDTLAATFTLAREEAVAGVWVAGRRLS